MLSKKSWNTNDDHVLPEREHSEPEVEVNGELTRKATNSIEEDSEEETEKWASRWSFILACIGSAVGLGNLWRFPMIAEKWGGGAFFIPYTISLFTIGIPLLAFEMAIGQVFRRAAAQSFGILHFRAVGVGLAGATIAFFIVTYYSAILGWSNVMFIKSFDPNLAWSIRDANGTDIIDIPTNHFFNDVLHLSDSPSNTYVISSVVFAGSLVQWVAVYLILSGGQEFISKAVWFTVLLPVLMMGILVIFGATLPGAGTGIHAYIGKWDLSVLSEGEIWADAFGQTFFSLSLATGVMTAFSSCNPTNQNVLQDAMIVAISNSMFSFLSGFAVFSIMGYFSHESNLSLEEIKNGGLLGGPKLAFIAFPSALSLIDGYGANILCILFFFTFLLLGIDSAFSLVESVIYNWRETKLFGSVSKIQMTRLICFVGFLISIMYCSDIGFYLLDVADAYVSTFGLVVVGFVEAVVGGWCYNRTSAMNKVGKLPIMLFDIMVPTAFLLFTILSLSLPYHNGLSKGAVFGISFGVALAVLLPGIFVPIYLAQRETNDWKTATYYVTIHNADTLKDRLNQVIVDGAPGNWKFPTAFAVWIKFIATPILLFLVGLNVEAFGDGGYDPASYPMVYIQIFGALLLCIIVSVIIAGAIIPTEFADPRLSQQEKPTRQPQVEAAEV